MAIARILAAAFVLLLGDGTPVATRAPFVPRQPVAQAPLPASLNCEPGAVSIDIDRPAGVTFERIERPTGPYTEPREFTFTQGPIRRVRLFLSATLPEGTVGRGSEAKLEVIAQTSPSATDVNESVAWWRLVSAPASNSLDNAAETLLFDAKTLSGCFTGDDCKFADVDPAADSATAMLILGFTRDLGGANANNWEHARLVLDFREQTPRVAVAVDCAYNEGGGACTAFDSGEMPRSELSCSWDAKASDFACSETSGELGHLDYQLISGKPGPSRDGEVASVEAAARRLAARSRGSVEIVTGLGRVRYVHDVAVGAKRVMVLASAGRFYVVDRTADGIGAVRTIRPRLLVPSDDSSDVAATGSGWTDESDPVFRAAEIYRDGQMVVLRVIAATQYDTTRAPRPNAMYWLALDVRGGDVTAAALTTVDPGSYGGCGSQAVPEVITAIGRIGRSFDVAVTVQPATSFSLAEELTWRSAELGDDNVECRRPAKIRWRDGTFDVQINDKACRTAQEPQFVVLGLDGPFGLRAARAARARHPSETPESG